MDEVEKMEESPCVCEVCMKDNLLKKVGILACEKCGKPFCIHFASRIDPVYCVDCMSEVSVTKEIISKTYEHYNEQTDKVVRYSRRARNIHFDGSDWLFAQRRISDLSDAEIDLAIEYHKGILQLLQKENEERKLAKMHRYANVKLTSVPSTTTTSTTTVKKSTKISSTKGQAQISSIISSMLAKGMKMEDIATLMMKGIK